MRLQIGFVFFFTCGAVAYATPRSNQEKFCAEIAARIAHEYQRGALGFTSDNLAETLPEQFADGSEFWKAFSAKPAKEFWSDLHEDVLNYLTTARDRRDLAAFAKKYRFTEDQANDVLTYYVSRNYFNELTALGDPREILTRLSASFRAHRLTDEENELARLYPIYLFHVTQKSVPEIVAMLNKHRPPGQREITEQTVYQQLKRLRISIEDQFLIPVTPAQALKMRALAKDEGVSLEGVELEGQPLAEVAESFRERGVSMAEVAKRLGVGESALDYVIRHRENLRGTPWNREAEFEGKRLKESAILEVLWGRKKSSQQIAQELNKTFPPRNPRELRSQAAILEKAKALGLIEATAAEKEPDIEHPVYGILKQNGRLNPETVVPFIYDHHQLSRSRLAAALEIDERRLGNFLSKHDIPLFTPRYAPAPVQRGALSATEYAAFMDEDSGLFTQVAAMKGFTMRMDDLLETLAREKIRDPARLATTLKDLKIIGVTRDDGNSARQKHKPPADRIHASLVAIAKGMGVIDPVLRTQSDGARVFGFAIPEKKRPPVAPVLLDGDFAQFTDPSKGLFSQLDEIPGLGSRAPKALATFARKKIKDEEKLKTVLTELSSLELLNFDGRNARAGHKAPTYRIHAALMIIAKGMGEGKPVLLTQVQGNKIFGFSVRDRSKAYASPELPPEKLEIFTTPESGLLARFAESRDFQYETKAYLREFARQQITNRGKLNRTLEKLERIGILAEDGRNAMRGKKRSAFRIHDALVTIANGRDKKDVPLFTHEDGGKVFEFK